MTEEQPSSPGKDVQEITGTPLDKGYFLKIASEKRDPNNRNMLLASLPKEIRNRLDSTHPTYQRNYDIWQAQLDAFLGEEHSVLQGGGRENLAKEIYQTLRSFGLDLTDRNLPLDKLVKEFLNSHNLQPFKKPLGFYGTGRIGEAPFESRTKVVSRERPPQSPLEPKPKQEEFREPSPLVPGESEPPEIEEKKISPSIPAVEAGTVQPAKEELVAVKEPEETPVKPGDRVNIVFGKEKITYTPSDQDAERYWQNLLPENRDHWEKLIRTSIEMSAKQGTLGVPVQDINSGFQEADKELMAAFCQQARELGYEIVGDFELNPWTKRVEAPIRKIETETPSSAASEIPVPETTLTPERQAPEETKQLVNGPSEDDTEYATRYWQKQGSRAEEGAEEWILKHLSDIADGEGVAYIHNGPGDIWPITREYFAVYRQIAKEGGYELGNFQRSNSQDPYFRATIQRIPTVSP